MIHRERRKRDKTHGRKPLAGPRPQDVRFTPNPHDLTKYPPKSVPSSCDLAPDPDRPNHGDSHTRGTTASPRHHAGHLPANTLNPPHIQGCICLRASKPTTRRPHGLVPAFKHAAIVDSQCATRAGCYCTGVGGPSIASLGLPNEPDTAPSPQVSWLSSDRSDRPNVHPNVIERGWRSREAHPNTPDGPPSLLAITT